ncbi:response regulator [Marivirga tractuosa]|uniref:response regulator n=1 Tax=Marivirga tractuosa TaxID=1006 RepID=UPI0035CEC7EB
MAIFKNICIIDDDELFLLVSKSIMEDEDFAENIHNFEDAKEALNYLNTVAAKELPEILFLDINMPMMDGWEFMDAIQDSKIVNEIKIYITSSSINPMDLEKAERNPSIKGFVSKPLEPNKLKKIAYDRFKN